MSLGLIDVWDGKTFDGELGATLAKEAGLVRKYMTTEHRIFLAHDLGRDPEKSIFRPENPVLLLSSNWKRRFGERMQSRTIRAWHYTRLTATEVTTLRREGIPLSTPSTLRSRLDLLVASGELSVRLADALFAASPFHSNQFEARSKKFWMVSHPVAIHDGGVEPLVAHWGGEVASMSTKDPELLAPLAATGEPRIIELAVPLALTRYSCRLEKRW